MNRTATWNRIGTDITEARTINEALDLSGLNYFVEKRPIFLENGFQIKDQYATAKVGSNEVFGIVGKEYEIVQNSDAFAFVDNIISEGLQFVKAGENANMNYIIAKMPEQYILDDRFDPYIIFQNSHNGYSTLKAAICPLRIVCSNQFAMAFKNAETKISLRHSSSIHDRLENAQNILRASAAYMDTFAQQAEDMANIKVSKYDEEKIVNAYFTVSEDATTRKINAVEEKKQFFLNALNAEDNQNFRGTAWGMMNAFTDYLTHLEPSRKTEKSDMSKFLSVTFDPKNIQNFSNILLEQVA